MKPIFALLVGLVAASLVNAESYPPIQSFKPDACSWRIAYSAMAENGHDGAWVYSVPGSKAGEQRLITLHISAEQRADKKQKSCRHWQLPYSDLVIQSLSIGSALTSGEVAVTIAAKSLNGKSVSCTALYGFTPNGVLRDTLTDQGCLEKR